MNRTISILACLVFAAALLPSSALAECVVTTEPSEPLPLCAAGYGPDTDLVIRYNACTFFLAGAQFYVVQDDCNGGCFAHWGVYRELNGFGGLQRDDVGYFDTCGFIPADPAVL